MSAEMLRKVFYSQDLDDNVLRIHIKNYSQSFASIDADKLTRYLAETETDKIDWIYVYQLYALLPSAPQMRECLIQFLVRLLSFVAKSEEQCHWLHQQEAYYQFLLHPIELSNLLNICLRKKIPTEPSEWLEKAKDKLSDWLPIEWLYADPEFYPLVLTLSDAILVQDKTLTDVVARLLNNKLFANLLDHQEFLQNRFFELVHQSCDEIEHQIGAEEADIFYTLIREFISTKCYYDSKGQAREKLLLLADAVAEYNPLFKIIPLRHYGRLIEIAFVQSSGINNRLPLCPVSFTPLRLNARGIWQTAYPDTQVKYQLKCGAIQPWYDPDLHLTSELVVLHQQLIRFWYLPGIVELATAKAAEECGWTVTKWPHRDETDLLLSHPKATRQVAIDGKDRSSPFELGQSFEGFKRFSDPERYRCLIVVPDYRLNQPDYRDNFHLAAKRSGNKWTMLSLSELRLWLNNPEKFAGVYCPLAEEITK